MSNETHESKKPFKKTVRGRVLAGLAATTGAVVMLPGCSSANTAPEPTPTTKSAEFHKPATLELTPQQLENVHRAARETAGAIVQNMKTLGAEDKWDGYGQFRLTKGDIRKGAGEAIWVRLFNTPDGIQVNLERIITSEDTEPGSDEPETVLVQDYNFLNPDTPVFADGVLTSEEAAKLFKDSNTRLTSGFVEAGGLKLDATLVTIDGNRVTSKAGEKVGYDQQGNITGLTPNEDPADVKANLEWVLNAR